LLKNNGTLEKSIELMEKQQSIIYSKKP